ncbi:MAG: CocE/NonD family hydrolase [Acidimicrobiales bacterium]
MDPSRLAVRLPLHLSAVAFLSLALLAAGCSGSEGDAAAPVDDIAIEPADTEAPGSDSAADTSTASEDAGPDTTEPATVPADFAAAAAAGQVTVTGAAAGTELTLRGPGDEQVGTVDELGNLLFRQVEPGEGWQVLALGSDPVLSSDALRVPDFDEHPDQAFFDSQEIGEGFGYIEMRDGTLLSATVRLPGPIEDGPYPTVVEYSGYDPSSPYEIEPAINIYGLLGWATVGVNMRGSGCSGGAFDYFEPMQSIDGYDVIEAIAAQDWVYENHVGMVGISYSGISQLFVAQTQPPNLAAITPISVIEDSYRSVVWPGGIYNNGFAKSWGESRQGANEAYGSAWVNQRIEEDGDEICDANQLLRSQNRDLGEAAAATAFWTDAEGDPLSPRTFVDQITVPTFLAGSWQDEQTGGRFATMLDDFTEAPVFKAHLYNGAHADSLGPQSLAAATELLDVYVAERVPQIDPVVRFGAPALYEAVFGVSGIELPPDRFASLDEARATLESEPAITMFLENGANPAALGAPVPRGAVSFEQWPPSAADAVTWNLGDVVGGESIAAFTVDVARSQLLTKAADDDGDEFEHLQWEPVEAGKAIVFETEPLSEDLLLTGSGRVSLSVQADEADADLQVTVSEVRPDGLEMYVQSGWLRASHRALDDSETTEVLPWHLFTEAANEPLPTGQFTKVDVAVFPAGHVFRAGSVVRLIVDSPGGNRNLWAFDVLGFDGSQVRIDPAASSLTLPFVSGVDVPAERPDCEHTRSQPCRPWVPYVNTPAQ